MKKVNFKFKSYNYSSRSYDIDGIIAYYNNIIKDYFSLVHNKRDVQLKYKRIRGLEEVLSNNNAYFIEIINKNNGYQIASFYTYGQNDCCGARTFSKTRIDSPYRKKKLAHILQIFKEDLGYHSNSGMLTCTDVYINSFNKENNINNDLRSNNRNVNILIKNGWELSNLFYNKNSSNLVGFFIKKLPTRREEKSSKEYSMDISLEEEKIILIEDVMIGGDPELFLFDYKNNKTVPSYNYISGDKANPEPISNDGHYIQVDNISLEYNFPPCTNKLEFIDNNIFIQDYIKRTITEPNGLSIDFRSSIEIPEELKSDERANVFGCLPDLNVWDYCSENKINTEGLNHRSCGGHIHISYKNNNDITSKYIVKALDLFLSVPLVLLEPESERKKIYGRAGSFRFKEWGLEYRTTSNYIYSSEELMSWTYDRIQDAINYIISHRNLPNIIALDNICNEIEQTINNNDKKEAEKLVKRFNIKLLTNKKEKICVD